MKEKIFALIAGAMFIGGMGYLYVSIQSYLATSAINTDVGGMVKTIQKSVAKTHDYYTLTTRYVAKSGLAPEEYALNVDDAFDLPAGITLTISTEIPYRDFTLSFKGAPWMVCRSLLGSKSVLLGADLKPRHLEVNGASVPALPGVEAACMKFQDNDFEISYR